MSVTEILPRACAAVESLAERLAAVLCDLPSAAAPVSAAWTGRDAAAHLVSVGTLYAGLACGVSSPIQELTSAAVREFNAIRLADIAETEPGELAKGVAAAAAEFVHAVSGRPGTAPVRWHGGIPLQLAQLAGVLVGEFVLHGYDIAVAVDAAWPISPDHVALASSPARALLPFLVDPAASRGHTATYRVDLGPSGRSSVRFLDGVVSGAGDEVPVDCEISADPVAFFLLRRGRLDRAAAIALGLLRYGGARPDLGAGYLRLFRSF